MSTAAINHMKKQETEIGLNTARTSEVRQLDRQSCSTGYSSTEISPKSKTRRSGSPVSSIFTSNFKEEEQLIYQDPTEEMNMRWLKLIQLQAPTIDLVDMSLEVYPFNSYKRQFAPEYSFSAYLTMLRQEYAIGNYLQNPNCSLKISDYTRQQMIMLIEDLASIK